MKKKDRIEKTCKELLYNLSETQNNNENINLEQTHYYRGIILAVIALLMAEYNCNWYTAMKMVEYLRPLDSDRIYKMCLPFGWNIP